MAARPASFPCPNPMCLETTVTAPSAPMRRNGPNGPKWESEPSDMMSGSTACGEHPISRPPPAAAAAITTISRRVGLAKDLMGAFMASLPSGHGGVDGGHVRGALDGGANALITAATTDVATHRPIDVSVARARRLGQEGSGGHDLARLAVAPLRHIRFPPGRRHGMQALQAPDAG